MYVRIYSYMTKVWKIINSKFSSSSYTGLSLIIRVVLTKRLHIVTDPANSITSVRTLKQNNFCCVYSTTVNFLALIKQFVGNLMEFTEVIYHIQRRRYIEYKVTGCNCLIIIVTYTIHTYSSLLLYTAHLSMSSSEKACMNGKFDEIISNSSTLILPELSVS